MDKSNTVSQLLVFVTGVAYPKTSRLDVHDLYKDNKPNYAILKYHFQQEGRITEKAALQIIDDATQLLKQEPTLLDVEAPVTSTLQDVLV